MDRAERYCKRILKKYGIQEDDTPYFISYALGYFDSRYKEPMTEQEASRLLDEASRAAQKYVKSLDEEEEECS